MIDDHKLPLSDIGNYIFGYTAAKAGISYDYLEKSAFVETYALKTKTIEKTYQNELPDRALYKRGYELAKNTPT